MTTLWPVAKTTTMTTLCQHGGGDDIDATAKMTVMVSTPCQYDRGDDVDATTMANAMKMMMMTSSLCAWRRDDPMPAHH